MPDLSKTQEDSRQISLFSEMCRSANLSSHIHSDEARSVTFPCSGRGRLNIVTCQDDGNIDDMADVNGLDMSGINLQISMTSVLPDFIPIIPRGMFGRNSYEIPSEIVGVMLNDILTKRMSARHGYYRLPDNTTIDTDILRRPVFQGKKVILFSVGQDILIETLWWERHKMNLFRIITDIGFFAVTGMNFSLISGECPFGHALNIKKTLCYCKELDQLGVGTIPHVYAVNQYQRERWKIWLLANPSVKVITINSQLQKRQKRGMGDVFDTANFLLENTAVEIIIHGRAKGALAGLKKQYPGRIHFAASGPLKNALIRKDKTVTEYINIFLNDLTISTLS